MGETSLKIIAAAVMMLIKAPANPNEKTVALFCEMYFFMKKISPSFVTIIGLSDLKSYHNTVTIGYNFVTGLCNLFQFGNNLLQTGKCKLYDLTFYIVSDSILRKL